jgi:hypothetical protein
MGIHIECLINKIKTILLRVIPKNVLFLATATEFHHTAADQVVDVAFFVDEHKAFVAYPLARYGLISILFNESKCFFKTILLVFFRNGALLECLVHHLCVILK